MKSISRGSVNATTAFVVVIVLMLSSHVSCSGSSVTTVTNSIFDYAGRNDSINMTDLIGGMVNQLTSRINCDVYGLKKEDCASCLKTESIMEVLGISSDRNYITDIDILDISTLLLHHILYFPTFCAIQPPGCRNYLVCRDQLLQLLQQPEGAMHSLQYIFRELKHVLEPVPTQECFSAKSVLMESRNFSSDLVLVHDDTIVNVMRHVVLGHCIDVSESVSHFIDDIFHSYGTACSSVIDIEGLKHIKEDLHKDKNSHNHVHDHSNENGHNHDHSNENGHNHDHSHEKDILECEQMRKPNTDHPHSHQDNEHFTKLDDIHEHENIHDNHSHGNTHDNHSHGNTHDNHSHGNTHDNHSHENIDRNIFSERIVEHETDSNFESSADKHNQSEILSYHPEHNDKKKTNDYTSHNYNTKSSNLTFISTTVEPEINSETMKILIFNDVVTLSPISKHLMYKENEDDSVATEKFSKSSLAENHSDVINSDVSMASALRSEFFHQDDDAQRQNSIPFSENSNQKLFNRINNGPNDVESLEHYPFMDHLPSLAEKCLSVEELLESFGHSAKASITRLEFFEICPALVQQKISGICNKHIMKKRDEPTMLELYGYSTLAVLIISLTSLAGVVLLPILAKQIYYYIMAGCIGLAFSTLAGDALLHLIPQVLGIHSHGDDDHSHDHNDGLYDPTLLKQLAIFLAIYLLYLFQACVCAFSKNKHSPGRGGHGHTHIPEALSKELTLVSVKVKSDSSVTLAPQTAQSTTSLDTEIAENEISHERNHNLLSAPTLCGLSTVALLITLGDSIHNFSDGLAIGAAFSSGVRSGVSTSIAVFCHELPHEFGDFVVLLSTGLSFSKALWLNFLSGLTCFIGLYIGIQLGVDEEARTWIMGVTAGIFLYVAMTEMLPDLKEGNKGSPVKMLIVKNVGILAGLAIMVIISVYEHSFYF